MPSSLKSKRSGEVSLATFVGDASWRYVSKTLSAASRCARRLWPGCLRQADHGRRRRAKYLLLDLETGRRFSSISA